MQELFKVEFRGSNLMRESLKLFAYWALKLIDLVTVVVNCANKSYDARWRLSPQAENLTYECLVIEAE